MSPPRTMTERCFSFSNKKIVAINAILRPSPKATWEPHSCEMTSFWRFWADLPCWCPCRWGLPLMFVNFASHQCVCVCCGLYGSWLIWPRHHHCTVNRFYQRIRIVQRKIEVRNGIKVMQLRCCFRRLKFCQECNLMVCVLDRGRMEKNCDGRSAMCGVTELLQVMVTKIWWNTCKQYTVHIGTLPAFAHSSTRERALTNNLTWPKTELQLKPSRFISAQFPKTSSVVIAVCSHRLHGHPCTTRTLCTQTPLSTKTTRKPLSLIAITRQRTPALEACLSLFAERASHKLWWSPTSI